MSGLYSNRDLRTVCGLRIHESPHNPSLTSTLIYKKTTSIETLLSGEEPTDKDEHWTHSVSRSSNTSEYWETERDLATLSPKSVANSNPYMRSSPRN